MQIIFQESYKAVKNLQEVHFYSLYLSKISTEIDWRMWIFKYSGFTVTLI